VSDGWSPRAAEIREAPAAAQPFAR
jgi:hypothetical protein